MRGRVLVAGVGNVFFGDDGFGPAVVAALAGRRPPGVHVEDFGIRGLHLAFELTSGYDGAVIVDTVRRGEAPGTVSLIEPSAVSPAGAPDAHGMDLGSVFAAAHAFGGTLPPLLLVGCEPASLDDGIGLSAAVGAAIEPAVALVRRAIHWEDRVCEV